MGDDKVVQRPLSELVCVASLNCVAKGRVPHYAREPLGWRVQPVIAEHTIQAGARCLDIGVTVVVKKQVDRL